MSSRCSRYSNKISFISNAERARDNPLARSFFLVHVLVMHYTGDKPSLFLPCRQTQRPKELIMDNPNSSFSKLFRLICLALFCILMSGCFLLDENNSFGGPPPPADVNNMLIFHNQNGLFTYDSTADAICYDSANYYFLRGVKGDMQVYHAVGSGQPEVFFRLYNAWEIASWGDKLVIYGALTNRDLNSLIVLDKQSPEQSEIFPYERRRTFTLSDGYAVKVNVALPPLRFVFNENTVGKPIETLCEEQFGYTNPGLYSKEDWEVLFRETDAQTKEFRFSGLEDDWVINVGNWVYWLTNKHAKDGKYKIINFCYHHLNAPPGGDILYGNKDLFSYNGHLYYFEENGTLYPSVESGKLAIQIKSTEGYSACEHYIGKQGRMQYFVFSAYSSGGERISYEDIKFFTGHRIYAIDLETMELTKELTLSTPREQVLYVNEAGAYTWRQEECRVFFTPWQGEAVAVSDVIPYVPRYETPQDEKENDACNVWYAEVDAARNRLLLFDMTQGETALLAVVDLPY